MITRRDLIVAAISVFTFIFYLANKMYINRP